MDDHIVEEGHEDVEALLGGGGKRGEGHVGGCGKGRGEGSGDEGGEVVGKGTLVVYISWYWKQC